MGKKLFLEIGTEELPSSLFLKNVSKIRESWGNALREYNIYSDFKYYYTPRRIIFLHNNFQKKQPSKVECIYGPPLNIAFRGDKLTSIGESFLDKNRVALKDLSTSVKRGKDVLFYKKEIDGSYSRDILVDIIRYFLEHFNFTKLMRWDNFDYDFVRPLRWLGCFFDGEFLKFKLFGVTSSNITYINRSISTKPIRYKDIDEYFKMVAKGGVVIDQNVRRRMITSQFKKLEEEHSFIIDKDDALIDEVVAISEYPKAIIASFDKTFLETPKEITTLFMKSHQKYFPIYSKNTKTLTNKFIFISNLVSEDYQKNIEGNQRVIRARLSDATFFYKSDLRDGFNVDALKSVAFIDGLGTMYDKEIREWKIAKKLFFIYKDRLLKEFKCSKEEVVLGALKRAIMLSKVDLLTRTVGEFKELKGVFGYLYLISEKTDENPLIPLAIREQYSPSKNLKIPTTYFSSIVALSYNLDNIFSFFSIGKIASGSKDPFKLRRSASTIIKILIAKELSFDLNTLLEDISTIYAPFDLQILKNFFIERIISYLSDYSFCLNAILDQGEMDVLEIFNKAKSLFNIIKGSNAKDLSQTFKRVANIIKDVTFLDSKQCVDISLFQSIYEKDLFLSFQKANSIKYDNYEDKLNALFGLKDKIDIFFDRVTINVSDENIKLNRRKLIHLICSSFEDIADIKKINF